MGTLPKFEVLEELVNALIDMKEKEGRWNPFIQEMAEAHFLTIYDEVKCSIINVIQMLFNDEGKYSIIDHFIYECQFGKTSSSYPITIDGKEYILENIQALYDYYKAYHFDDQGNPYLFKVEPKENIDGNEIFEEIFKFKKKGKRND